METSVLDTRIPEFDVLEPRGFTNAAHGYSYYEVASLIAKRTGKNPVHIRCQALLVISSFEDGSRAVHRIDDLAC